MALTSIGSQKTPGRPVEITFAADTGIPSDLQTVLIMGHAASGATGVNTVVSINNAGDLTAVTAEANTKFGAGSELAKMVIAAVAANVVTSNYPALLAVPLLSSATDIPSAAQAAIQKVKADFIVTPYDLSTSTANRTALKALCALMSGSARVENNQFGTFGVGANQSVSDPSTLNKFDTQFLIGIWARDTAPVYSLGEVAAAAAAVMAGNGIPFNPLDDVTLASVPAPVNGSDWISVGAGLESETCLNQGWTPLRVKPNGEVAFVRTVTGRLSADGSGTPVVTAYYDVQDFQVLYYWRKTIYTRFSQPDFKKRKASEQAAQDIKSEAIRLATAFEDQNMFQAVSKLAKQFVVQRSATDRSRMDVQTPVNVIPGLHVIATNVIATTQYDTVTV